MHIDALLGASALGSPGKVRRSAIGREPSEASRLKAAVASLISKADAQIVRDGSSSASTGDHRDRPQSADIFGKVEKSGDQKRLVRCEFVASSWVSP